MTSILLTGPAIEPISLEETKTFLRIEHNDEDELIAALIAGARSHIEAQTQTALITQDWRVVLDAWPQRGYGVNSGVARSGKVLRRILKLSDASSTITDAVVAAACATDAERLVKLICDERLRFLQSLRTWPVFGIGWGRRVADVRSVALKLAADGRTTSSTGAWMAGH